MKVVFVKAVPQVAGVGEVKEVANGYALNYLIPLKFAMPATSKNLERAAVVQKQQTNKKNTVKVDKADLARQLKGFTVAVSGKADESGTLFAGITKDTIAKKLTAAGLPVKSKQISLAEPFKKPGQYQVGVNVDSGMKVMTTVVVSTEK